MNVTFLAVEEREYVTAMYSPTLAVVHDKPEPAPAPTGDADLDADVPVDFEDLLNLAEIQRMQDLFSAATGVASIITTPAGEPLTKPSNFCRLCRDIIRGTEKGRANCFCSDAVIGGRNTSGPTIQPCLSGGLWDAGASIVVGGHHIANWLIGQVRNEALDTDRLLSYARQIGADEAEFVKALDEVPVMSQERFEAVAEALFLMANEISTKAYGGVRQAQFIRQLQSVEERLRASEARYRVVSEHTGQMIYEWDIPSGEFTWSGRTEEIVGYTVEELQRWGSAGLAENMHPEDRDRALSELGRSMKARTAYNCQYRFRQADGEYIVVENQGTFEYTEDGPVRMLGVVKDVSEQVRARQEILNLNKILESRVARRTAELNAAVKELEAFSYSVSHDLRAPLRHIVGFAAILQEKRETGLDDEGMHCLEVITGAAYRMNKLIDDLLSFSRVSRADVDRADVDMRALVLEVLDDMAPDLEKRSLSPSVGDLPVVRADRALIKQVWANLISNAVKYTAPTPEPVIEIDLVPDADQWVFCVSDNGVGFDQSRAADLFGVFQRLHSESEFEGTGIGLAIVQRVVRRHGGAVWADGETDKGARFYFSLPKLRKEG
jgi:PAS domain S-box-containing protein